MTGAAVLAATMASGAHAEVTCDPTATTNPLQQGINCSAPTGAKDNLFVSGGIFHTVADTLIFLVGAISVIMLIVGGLRYVLSSGESAAVKSAKDTILYAIVGIVVAILAFAIVSFVAGRFNTTP